MKPWYPHDGARPMIVHEPGPFDTAAGIARAVGFGVIVWIIVVALGVALWRLLA